MKIFISIASYRDSDLNNTIGNLLTNSKNPERLHIGVCYQHGNESWEDISEYRNYANISIIDINYRDSKGACWARSLIQNIYSGEDWILQIDSHSRFEPNWDQKLIDIYNDIGDDSAILTAYPAPFKPSQSYAEYDKNVYVCHVYGMKNNMLRTRPKVFENYTEARRPRRALHLAAGFVFGPGRINSIRYDPEFYFSGEETAMAMRYWTSGYNLYHPHKNIIYHYYTRSECKKHWDDHVDSGEYTAKCHDRLNCLLKRHNKYNLGIYGLGDKRSYDEWKYYSGIDHINYALNEETMMCKEPPVNCNRNWITQDQMNLP